jgi:WD40 repeat protein
MNLYDDYFENTVLRFKKFAKDNTYRRVYPDARAISVWEKIGHGNTAVTKISWLSNDSFAFYTGRNGDTKVECALGEKNAYVTAITSCEQTTANELKVEVPNVKLPGVPGRQYLATAESSVRLSDSRILVGTRDSMLALIDGDKVFSLGCVSAPGGIHSLDVTPNGTVYGIASHKLGVGQLFKFTVDGGVELIGLVPEALADSGRNVSIYRPTTLSISPDGKYLAIGGADEVGGVVIIPAS